jgi:hypothetical protein
MVLVSIIASFFNAQAQPVVELYLHASLFFEAWVCLFYEGFIPVMYALLNFFSMSVSVMVITTLFPLFGTFSCLFETANITACAIHHVSMFQNANVTNDVRQLHGVMMAAASDVFRAGWLQKKKKKNNQTLLAHMGYEF